MWVRFRAPWDWRLPSSTVAYRAADYNVPSACGELATAAGVATRLRKTSKTEEPTEWPNDLVPALSTGV